MVDMRCRRIKKWIDDKGIEHNNIVWFGSTGKSKVGTEYSEDITFDVRITKIKVLAKDSLVRFDFTLEEETSFLQIRMYSRTGSVQTKVFDKTYTGVGQHTEYIKLTRDIRQINFYKEDDSEFLTVSVLSTQSDKAIFFNPDDKNDNFSSDLDAVVDSVTQRLSIIKRELWYNINYGLSLLDKVKSKHLIDTSVLGIITSHPDVTRILDFKSSTERHEYSCQVSVLSKYGKINLTI